jgi:hypothetical protein
MHKVYDDIIHAAMQGMSDPLQVERVWTVIESSDASSEQRCAAYVVLGTYADAVDRSYGESYGRIGFFCAALLHSPESEDAKRGLHSVLAEGDPAIRVDQGLWRMVASS